MEKVEPPPFLDTPMLLVKPSVGLATPEIFKVGLRIRPILALAAPAWPGLRLTRAPSFLHTCGGTAPFESVPQALGLEKGQAYSGGHATSDPKALLGRLYKEGPSNEASALVVRLSQTFPDANGNCPFSYHSCVSTTSRLPRSPVCPSWPSSSGDCGKRGVPGASRPPS